MSYRTLAPPRSAGSSPPGRYPLNPAADWVQNAHEYTPLYAVDARGHAVAAERPKGYKYTIVSREGRLLVVVVIIIIVIIIVVVVIIIHVHALRVLLRVP